MHKAGCFCSIAHLGTCMKFIASSRRCIFTLLLKGKDRATGLKEVSSWLQTPEIEVDALYRCLHQAVYPLNVQTAMTTPRDHQFLFCIHLSLLLPFPQTHTQRNIKRLIHTNVLSAGSVRRRLPLHPSIRRCKTSERKEKKGSHKVHCQNKLKCFQELIEDSWMLVQTTEIKKKILFWTLEHTGLTSHKYTNT